MDNFISKKSVTIVSWFDIKKQDLEICNFTNKQEAASFIDTSLFAKGIGDVYVKTIATLSRKLS